MEKSNVQPAMSYTSKSITYLYLLLGFYIVLFLLAIKFLEIDFQDNDDYIYTMITSGAYSGTPSALTVYEGYFYGWFVSKLYAIFSLDIEWYIVVMHGLSILSFSAIVLKIFYIDLLSMKVKVFTSIGCFFFQVYLLLSPQFTILAGELALTSAVLLICTNKLRLILLAGIFAFLSIQIRFNAFAMVFIPMMPLAFLSYSRILCIYWKKLILVIGFITASFILNIYTNKTYYSGDSWDYYLSFNHPRGIIEQNLCKEKAASLFTDTIKMNEYLNMCNFGLIDGKLLSIDEMNKCASYVQNFKNDFMRQNLKPYYYGFRNHCLWLLSLWILVLIYLGIKKKKWSDLMMISSVLILSFVEILYCMNTSFVKERLIICFIFIFFALALYFTYKLVNSRNLIYTSLLVCVLVSAFYVRKSWIWENDVRQRLEATEELNSLLSHLKYNKVHMLGISPCAEAYRVSKTPCTSKYIGKGWLNNLPLHEGFYSNYLSLIDGVPIAKMKGYNKNILFIKNVLAKHYNKNVEIKTLLSSNHYEIIQFRSLDKYASSKFK